MVNVALPALGRNLGADAAALQWTINAYLLPLSALLLVGGAAGDRVGRRRLLIAGVALFALASLACAAAPRLPVLLAARAVQKFGAAALMPNSLALLGNAFSGDEARPCDRHLGGGGGDRRRGPPLVGWLVEAVGWRAIFAINLPLAAGAMLLAWWFVAETETGDQPLDPPGAALATAALFAVALGLTWWSSARTFGPASGIALAAGAAALAG